MTSTQRHAQLNAIPTLRRALLQPVHYCNNAGSTPNLTFPVNWTESRAQSTTGWGQNTVTISAIVWQNFRDGYGTCRPSNTHCVHCSATSSLRCAHQNITSTLRHAQPQHVHNCTTAGSSHFFRAIAASIKLEFHCFAFKLAWMGLTQGIHTCLTQYK